MPSIGVIKTQLVFLLFSMSLLANTAFADNSARLVSLLKPMETLTGQFRQTLSDKDGQLIQDASGEFALKRPGFFRWQTLDPYPQLLISDLQKLWLYDPDLEQVTVRDYTESLNKTPALLLSGDPQKLEDNYTVEATQVDGANAEGFVLVSKDQSPLFEKLTLVFDNQQLAKMELLDSLGQLSVFYFSDTKANTAIDEGTFEFVPPAGVDIIADEQ